MEMRRRGNRNLFGPWSSLRAARGAVSSAREERSASWIGGRRARSLRWPGVVLRISPGVSPGRLVQPRPGRGRSREIASLQWLDSFPAPRQSPPGRLPRPEWSGMVRDSPGWSGLVRHRRSGPPSGRTPRPPARPARTGGLDRRNGLSASVAKRRAVALGNIVGLLRRPGPDEARR